MTGLVLSLFPGIGLLDMAFEEEGFCVVRGPDLLWGGDIRRFHPPAGRFDGVIGGPPCQAHSRLAALNRHRGNKVAVDMTPEFRRVVAAAHPAWWLMENVPGVPDQHIRGYEMHRVQFNNRDLGEQQSRERAFQFGTASGSRLRISFREAIFKQSFEPTCLASEGGCGMIGRKKRYGRQSATYQPRRTFQRFCELQGLPPDFLADAPFTVEAKYRAVGNGVPLAMGRAVARAVKAALSDKAAA